MFVQVSFSKKKEDDTIMDLLVNTLERARRIRILQKRAYENFLKTVAQQIDFLQRQGITSVVIYIPKVINGTSVRQEDVCTKLRRTLRDVGYDVKEMPLHGLEISWLIE